MNKEPELVLGEFNQKPTLILNHPYQDCKVYLSDKDGMGFQISSDKEGDEALFHVLNMDNDNTANFISGLFDITTKTKMYHLYERYNFEVIAHLFDILFKTNNMNQILSIKAKEIIKSYIALNYSYYTSEEPPKWV